MRLKLLGLISILSCLGACSSLERPTIDMIYASSAMKASERAQAERKSPDLFNRAQNSFWKAQKYYVAKEYPEAAKAAFDARRLAEKAELDAELKALQASSANPGE